MLRLIVLVLSCVSFVGCSTADNLWRMDENRPGYVLEHEDLGEGKFKARLTKGQGHVLELRNIDESNSDVVLIHTAWIEIEGDGRVLKGLLKRVMRSGLKKGSYHGSRETWRKITGGQVNLNAEGEGTFVLQYELNSSRAELRGEIVPKTVNR